MSLNALDLRIRSGVLTGKERGLPSRLMVFRGFRV